MRRAPLAILLAGTLLAAPSRAEETDTSLVAEGIQLRREKRDAEALERFRKAYEIRPAPKIRVQIALAEQALGDWLSAERDLSEALSHDDPWIAERSEALKESLTEIRTHLALLQIETNVAGAELWQKGVLVGKVSAEPMRVASGPIEIEIRADGYPPARRSVSVPAQSLVKLVVDLNQVSERAAVLPSAMPVTVASPTISLQITLAWVTLAAAGASLTTGIIGHVVRDVNATNYNTDHCNVPENMALGSCQRYLGRVEPAQTVAIAGYVGAGVLGGTSALLFILAPKNSKPTAMLDFTLLPSAVGVTWRGEF